METDQFFRDDSDDPDEDEDGSRSQKPKKKSSLNKMQPRSNVSKYFANVDDANDDDVLNPDRMSVVMKAMKKEWWYDMFDVEQSQFDVRSLRMFVILHVDFCVD